MNEFEKEFIEPLNSILVEVELENFLEEFKINQMFVPKRNKKLNKISQKIAK